MTTETQKPIAEMTAEELDAKVKELVMAGGYKAAKAYINELVKREADEEKKAKEALQNKLAETTGKVQHLFDEIKKIITGEKQPTEAQAKRVTDLLLKFEGKELDGADGIWYAADFGESSTTIKLIKGSKRASTGGTGSGSSSYVTSEVSSKQMLDEVGDEVYFAEETKATIDHQEVTFAAGTTYRQAFNYSNNGGWRNRVRQALLAKTGRK